MKLSFRFFRREYCEEVDIRAWVKEIDIAPDMTVLQLKHLILFELYKPTSIAKAQFAHLQPYIPNEYKIGYPWYHDNKSYEDHKNTKHAGCWDGPRIDYAQIKRDKGEVPLLNLTKEPAGELKEPLLLVGNTLLPLLQEQDDANVLEVLQNLNIGNKEIQCIEDSLIHDEAFVETSEAMIQVECYGEWGKHCSWIKMPSIICTVGKMKTALSNCLGLDQYQGIEYSFLGSNYKNLPMEDESRVLLLWNTIDMEKNRILQSYAPQFTISIQTAQRPDLPSILDDGLEIYDARSLISQAQNTSNRYKANSILYKRLAFSGIGSLCVLSLATVAYAATTTCLEITIETEFVYTMFVGSAIVGAALGLAVYALRETMLNNAGIEAA